MIRCAHQCFALITSAFIVAPQAVCVAEAPATQPAAMQPRPPTRADRQGLSPAQWRQLDDCVDRGLAALVRMQTKDGAFLTDPNGEPGVTGLCTLALLARGYSPDEGVYRDNVRRAIDFILSCRQQDGLITLIPPVTTHFDPYKPSHTAAYSHAIAGLTLCEAYGLSAGYRHKEMTQTIRLAIEYALRLQKNRKVQAEEEGGWRYVVPYGDAESDISVTSWYLMFLRSARNAGFEVPSQVIDDALGYVERSFRPGGRVLYTLGGEYHADSAAIIGAGVLSFSLAGQHYSELAHKGAQHIASLRMPADFSSKHFYYKCFYCSQAMYQIGEPFWSPFFSRLTAELMKRQNLEGSWPADTGVNARWGSSYTTAMSVLSLVPPYQLLPIFQR